MTATDSLTLPPERLKAPAIAVVALGFVCGSIRLAAQFAYGYDFAVYRKAGSAIIHHQSLFGPWIGQHLGYPLPFTYPPLAAVLAVPFALIGGNAAYAIWNGVSIAALFLVVRATTAGLVQRYERPGVALATACALALALAPVQEEIRYGQVGLVLMAMCVFDCLPESTRLPRGVLVGAATAIKLVPGIFVPYLWLSGRRRAAVIAAGTFVALSAAAAVVTPSDSKTFWTSRVFDNSRVGNLGYVSNQSLNGVLVRAVGRHDRALWLVLAAVVAGFGLAHAVRASRCGRELLGIAFVALVGVLVSPVSWIHHLVWVVPVLAVVAGDATNRRRVAIAVSAAALFTLRLPYLAGSIPAAWHLGWIVAVLRDSDSIVCVALLLVLARIAGPAFRSGPTPSTDRTPRRARRPLRRASRTPGPRR